MDMTVTVYKSYKLKFAVKQYLADEGGMSEDSYGDEVDTMEEAIVLLERAITREQGRYHNWQIIVVIC